MRLEVFVARIWVCDSCSVIVLAPAEPRVFSDRVHDHMIRAHLEKGMTSLNGRVFFSSVFIHDPDEVQLGPGDVAEVENESYVRDEYKVARA